MQLLAWEQFLWLGRGVRKRDEIKEIIRLKEQGIKKGLKEDPVHKTSHMHPREPLEDSSRIPTSHLQLIIRLNILW